MKALTKAQTQSFEAWKNARIDEAGALIDFDLHTGTCPEGMTDTGDSCGDCVNLYELRWAKWRHVEHLHDVARQKRVPLKVLLAENEKITKAANETFAELSAEVAEPVVETPADETTPAPSVDVADDAQDVASDADGTSAAGLLATYRTIHADWVVAHDTLAKHESECGLVNICAAVQARRDEVIAADRRLLRALRELQDAGVSVERIASVHRESV